LDQSTNDIQVWIEGDLEKVDIVHLLLDGEYVDKVPCILESVLYSNGQHTLTIICYNVYDRRIGTQSVTINFDNKFHQTVVSGTYEECFEIMTTYIGNNKAKFRIVDMDEWENDIVLWESEEYDSGDIEITISDPCIPMEGFYRIQFFEIIDPNTPDPNTPMRILGDNPLFPYWEKICLKKPHINNDIEAVMSVLNKKIAKARFKAILKERAVLKSFGYDLITLYDEHLTGDNLLSCLSSGKTKVWIHHGHGSNETKGVLRTFIDVDDGRLYSYPGSATPQDDDLPGKWESKGYFLSSLGCWNNQKFKYVQIDACKSAVYNDFAKELGLVDNEWGIYTGWKDPVYPGNFMEGSTEWLYLYYKDLAQAHTVFNAFTYATINIVNGYITGDKFRTYGLYPQLARITK